MIYEIRCNNCNTYFKNDGDLSQFWDKKYKEYYAGCPNCKTDAYLMDLLQPNDVYFDCSLHESPVTLSECEKNCPHYYSCDTVASANDAVKKLYG